MQLFCELKYIYQLYYYFLSFLSIYCFIYLELLSISMTMRCFSNMFILIFNLINFVQKIYLV